MTTGPEISGRETRDVEDLVPDEAGEKAELDLVPISSTGTAVFLAAVVGGLLLGVRPVGPGEDAGRHDLAVRIGPGGDSCACWRWDM